MASRRRWECAGKPGVTHQVTFRLQRGVGVERVDATVTIHRGAFKKPQPEAEEQAEDVCKGIAAVLTSWLP